MRFKSESEDSIDCKSVYSEFRSAMLFSYFSSFERLSLGSDALHTVACVQVQTLPTAQDTPVLTDSLSRGNDPYTHACKARPLSTDGWTSLSVIVIVFVVVIVIDDPKLFLRFWMDVAFSGRTAVNIAQRCRT